MNRLLQYFLPALFLITPSVLWAQSATHSVILFKDSSCRLVLKPLDSVDNPANEEVSNATLTFYKSGKLIFIDSLYSYMPGIEFKDFNNDKIKDIVIPFVSSARSCIYNHLYLVDPIKKQLKRVAGFEELPNPSLSDTKYNIITTLALYGSTQAFAFYRILRNGKLIDLGPYVKLDLGGPDDNQLEKAIHQILLQDKKNAAIVRKHVNKK